VKSRSEANDGSIHWIRRRGCSLLSCVGGMLELVCKLADFGRLEAICLLSEDVPENILPVVKMITQ